MAALQSVKLSAHFKHCLESIEHFLPDADIPHTFDALLDELMDKVIPNLERFPDMGRVLLERPIRSVEVSNGAIRLEQQLDGIAGRNELREYVLANYVLLYAHHGTSVYLLSIRHHRQLSFDLASHWPP
ncbi:type II toxin-antitoxin system RelE/ParE family toxin [Luteibacter sp. NPDC031894]|uniref:type II toxin-antitoxin system RelE/ParE family toxin n=1 Tax=Luteibacter sp. NPDC031894 TaxID=3390572 RepID=UPI003D082175